MRDLIGAALLALSVLLATMLFVAITEAHPPDQQWRGMTLCPDITCSCTDSDQVIVEPPMCPPCPSCPAVSIRFHVGPCQQCKKKLDGSWWCAKCKADTGP
jgi:hypothetical protein